MPSTYPGRDEKSRSGGGGEARRGLVSRVYLKPDFRAGDVSYIGDDGCPFVATSGLDSSFVPRYARGYDIIYSRGMEFIRRENCTLRHDLCKFILSREENFCCEREGNKIHDYTCVFLWISIIS